MTTPCNIPASAAHHCSRFGPISAAKVTPTMHKQSRPLRFTMACLLAGTALFLAACIPTFSRSPAALAFNLKADRVTIDTLGWSPDGKLLASGGFETVVRIWSATDGSLVTTLDPFHGGSAAIAWSPNGQFLITCSHEPQDNVRLWDTATWQVITSFKPDPDSLITSVAWAPDNQHIAIGLEDISGLGTDNGALEIWDATTPRELVRFPHEQSIDSVAWSPKGTAIAAGTASIVPGKIDGVLLLWDVSGGLTTLPPPRAFLSGAGIITSVAWSPDQKALASGSQTAAVQVWDVASGKNTATFHGHTSTVTQVIWSPAGDRIASSSWDNTARIWDIATGNNLATFSHRDYVNTLVWSPTATRIASGDHQGEISMWDAPK